MFIVHIHLFLKIWIIPWSKVQSVVIWFEWMTFDLQQFGIKAAQEPQEGPTGWFQGVYLLNQQDGVT